MGKMIVQRSAGRAKKNYHSIDWVGRSIRLFLILIDVLIANCVLISPLAWILRDGLGPSAVESHGWPAVWRMFLCFYWGPILLGLVLGNVLLRIALRQRKGKQNDMKSTLENEHDS